VAKAFAGQHFPGIEVCRDFGPIVVAGSQPGFVARLSFYSKREDTRVPHVVSRVTYYSKTLGDPYPDYEDHEFQLVWFGKRTDNWTADVLQEGPDMNPNGNRPMDAMIANGRLIVLGYINHGPVHPALGANVYQRTCNCWKECQEEEMAWMGDPIRLPRVNGLKRPGPLKMIGRDYPTFLASGLAGPCTLDEIRYRWTGSKYVEVSTRPITTPLRLLDDMLGWAHRGKGKLVRGRCASARVYAVFLRLARKVPEDAHANFLRRNYSEFERHFGLAEVGHRFDFAVVKGRWVLANVRGWKPPADDE
jgi:hypothetical protein